MTEFEQVYRRYFQDVFRYAKALCGSDDLAAELTSETFFKAMQGLSSFQGRCEVRVWLCQIAKHCYYSHLRRQARWAGPVPLEMQAPGDVQQRADDQDAALRLHRLLHQLPEPYKEVFSLRVFGELSFAQIGCVFGKTENWACVTYHRAKTKLKDRMEAEQNENDLL